MKSSLLSVNKSWNRLMQFIGTPITVLIFLSWCSHTIGINNISMSIVFAIGVLFCSTNFYLALCEAILGIPFLFIFRGWFLIPINLPFLSKPFTWWDEQTAAAGFAAIVVVIILVKFSTYLSQKLEEKK